MSKKSNDKYITVFIPTFNGEPYLAECIEAILHQELPAGYSLELLVTDSGSTDSTLDILEKYKDKLILDQIPNSQFSHGGTRQRAAEMAKGEFILFLSQDATPSHYRWLINMIEPFYLDERIGCVFGRQIPRQNAAPTIKREVAGVFGGLGTPDTIAVHRHKSLVDNKDTATLNTFFSDVNSAVRRDLLVGPVPFRKLKYAEDQALAEDMLNHGYFKAYSPQGSVWHSNEYTAKQYFHRKFDEWIGLQESVGLQLKPSKRSLLLGWIRPTLTDWKFLLRDREYTPKSKIVWLIEAPFYNIAEKAGRYQALKNIHDSEARKKLSLEEKARS